MNLLWIKLLDWVYATYKITVVSVALDITTKNIPGGTKLKPFMTTESAAYTYHCKIFNDCVW